MKICQILQTGHIIFDIIIENVYWNFVWSSSDFFHQMTGHGIAFKSHIVNLTFDIQCTKCEWQHSVRPAQLLHNFNWTEFIEWRATLLSIVTTTKTRTSYSYSIILIRNHCPLLACCWLFSVHCSPNSHILFSASKKTLIQLLLIRKVEKPNEKRKENEMPTKYSLCPLYRQLWTLWLCQQCQHGRGRPVCICCLTQRKSVRNIENHCELWNRASICVCVC